jgi:hypothetical protein
MRWEGFAPFGADAQKGKKGHPIIVPNINEQLTAVHNENQILKKNAVR